MKFEALLSITALLVSLVSFAWTIVAHRYMAEHGSVHANMSALVGLYNRIEATPSVLRFHGVSTEELDAAGVTATEFAYLIASFEAASVYYRFHEKSPKPFQKSSLRYKLLATPATRKAWPLMSRFFEEDTAFQKKIETTLRLIDADTSGANGVRR